GMMAFAIIPAIRPKTIQPIIANISSSSDSKGSVIRARALLGRRRAYRFYIRPEDVLEGKQVSRRGSESRRRRGLSSIRSVVALRRTRGVAETIHPGRRGIKSCGA